MLFALLALLTAAFAAGCGEETEEPHINIGDMESGAGHNQRGRSCCLF